MRKITLLLPLLLVAGPALAEDLTEDTDLDITMTWDQEPDGWTYESRLYVPDVVPEGGLPVCILLHGANSDGSGLIASMQSYLSDHALVAPAGYLKGWNICQESSKAPDVEMVRQLVETLQGFDNVNPNAIRLLGFSNGASLTNRVYVENDNPGIDAVVTVVSQLSDVMNRAETFYEPSGEPDETEPFCGYDQVVQPLQTRRYLNICNVNDNIIPYEGGFSNVGVAFVEARLAAWLVARGKGFDGPPDLGDGEELADELFKYAYLDDAVVHLRGFAVHGWTADMRDYVSDFLGTWASAPEEDCPADLDGDQSVGGSDLSQILGAWSSNDADADLNGDGTVDGEDLATLLGDWGDC